MTTKRRVAATIAITAVLLAVSLGFSVQRVIHWNTIGWAGLSANPASNAKVPPSMSKTSWVMPGRVGFVYPGGPASKAGVKVNDVILSVNGIPLADRDALDRLDERVRVGDVVEYRVLRNGRERTIRVQIASPFKGTSMLITLALTVLLAAAYVAIALLVFVRKPEDRRAFVFCAMSLVAAVTLLVTTGMAYDSTGARGVAFGTKYLVTWSFFMVLALAGLPTTLHLALVFPKDRPIVVRRPYIIQWVYGLTIFGASLLVTVFTSIQFMSSARGLPYALGRALASGALLIALAGLIVALRIARRGRDEGMRKAFVSRPLQTLFAILAVVETLMVALRYAGLAGVGLVIAAILLVLLFLTIASYPILTCISLYRSYRDAGVEEKRQVKWPLWGTFVTIATKVLVVIVTILLTAMMSANAISAERWNPIIEACANFPRAVGLLIPISFAIAIFKYRLMNIDVIIRKTVSYAFLSGAIVIIYIILVGGAGTLLISFARVKSTTMVVASTIVVALVFVPLRNRMQTLVDRNLFRHRYHYPDALRAISADAVNAHDAGALLFMASEKLQQALQNRSVVCFTRRHDEMVAAEKVGVPDSIVGSLRVPATPLPDVAALKRIDSALVVPLRTSGGVHGLISFGAKLSGAAFDEEDRAFIESAASQLAVAIERIRLQREEADFEQARTMQQSLLPRETPRVAGLDVAGVWQPARAVGGDYYDLLELSPTQLAVCIGDVAGKGMPAALLMSGLQAAVRASAGEDVAPRDLCERVRRVVVSSLTGGRFVTFFFCTLDTTTRRLRWCNAGHNAPLIARTDGSVERLATGGPVFSRVFRDPYAEGSLDLRAGDRLVLFTDGASEAQGRDGEMFGETRLEELVVAHRTQTAAELQRTIVDAVLAFSGAELEDDLTLVVVAVAQ